MFEQFFLHFVILFHALFDVVVVHFVALLDIFIIELVYTAGKQRARPA